MNKNEETHSYRLKKVTTVRRTCPACNGTKLIGTGARCIDCKNGIAEHTVTTEDDLIKALHDIGFIQWIKDNFKRIEKGDNGNKKRNT